MKARTTAEAQTEWEKRKNRYGTTSGRRVQCDGRTVILIAVGHTNGAIRLHWIVGFQCEAFASIGHQVGDALRRE